MNKYKNENDELSREKQIYHSVCASETGDCAKDIFESYRKKAVIYKIKYKKKKMKIILENW
jgi:hypothetical protein